METIANITAAARNSVFGETAPTTQTTAEAPAGDTPGKATIDTPHHPGHIPEQVPTQPGTEAPAGAPPGKGTPDAPHDRGNEPEQIQSSGGPADMSSTTTTDPLLPSSTTPASKINKPNPSKPSEMKSALASHEATDTINQVPPTTNTSSSSDTESKAKKTGTAKPGSHSALFGLGPKDESGAGSGGTATHPPKSSRELSGTIEEAGETMGRQAEMEKRGASEDDTGGYVGLKKAAMEEEEKKKREKREKRENGGAEGKGWIGATTGGVAAAAAVAPGAGLEEEEEEREEKEEERDPRSLEKINSLGREISPGEMPDGTHRRSVVEDMPQGHHFGRKNTATDNAEKSGGFRDRLKNKFKSKK